MKFLSVCVLILGLCVYLKSEMTITRPYSTLEEIDGSPSNRYSLIKVPNGTLQDNTTFFTLLLSSVVPSNLPNDSTNYIQNRRTLQSGSTFFVSSATVDGISLFGSTIAGDTAKFRIVHTSTITGNSPIVLDQVLKIQFYDGSILESSPTYSGLATINFVNVSTSDKATISFVNTSTSNKATTDFVNIATGNKAIALTVATDTTTLKNRIDNLDSSTSSLTTRLTNLDSSTSTLTTRISNLDTSTSNITTRLDNVAVDTGTLLTSKLSSSAGSVNSFHLNTTTTAGRVGSATIVPQITFDDDGRLLAVTSVTISAGSGGGDNLGSHVATQTLDMGRFIVNNIASATAFGTITSTSGFVATEIFISSVIGMRISNPLRSGNLVQVGGGTFTVFQEGKVSVGTNIASALFTIWDPVATSTPPIFFEISTGTSKVFEITNSSLTSNAPTGHYFTGGAFQVGSLTDQPYNIVFDVNDGLSDGFHPQIGIDRSGDALWRFGYNANGSDVTEPSLRSPATVSLIEYTGAMNIALFQTGNISISTNINSSRLDVYNGSVTSRGTNSGFSALEGRSNFSSATISSQLLFNSTIPYGRLGEQLELNSLGIEGGIAINNFQNTSNAGIIDFNKSRGNAIGSHTIVANNVALGNIVFRGSDGSKYIEAAYIASNVDGTPGADDMPTRLVFTTTLDGSDSVTERMRIDNAGNVGIGATPNTRLHVNAAAGTDGPLMVVSTGTSTRIWCSS